MDSLPQEQRQIESGWGRISSTLGTGMSASDYHALTANAREAILTLMMEPQKTIIQRVMPAVADLAGSLMSDFVRTQIRSRIVGGSTVTTAPTTTIIEGETAPASVEGCPYCACARHLAAAYRYLTRAHERQEQPDVAAIYRELALREVYAASKDIETLHSAVNENTDRLKSTITGLGLALVPSAPTPDFAACAAQAWGASGLALDQAEWFEANLSAAHGRVSAIDQQIAEIDRAMGTGETGG